MRLLVSSVNLFTPGYAAEVKVSDTLAGAETLKLPILHKYKDHQACAEFPRKAYSTKATMQLKKPHTG